MSETNENSKKSNGIFILIILFLLISLAIMAYKWSGKNADLNGCKNEVTSLKSDMDGMNQMMSGYVGSMSNDLKADFQNMLKTYDELIEKDKSKADSLNVQKDKIKELIKDLDNSKRNGNLNARKVAQLNRENTTLRNIMRGYVVQIDSLNTLNVKLNSDLNQTTTKLSSTEVERDNYKHEAEVNADQVKKGSKLQAFGFSSAGLKMKLNNTTEETNKARNCIQIRSGFTISENPLTPAGNKTVYMQIIDPDGKTLQSRSSNTLTTDDGSIAYSDKKDIDYQNQRIDMTIYYDMQNNEAVKGNYKVKIFCDGLLIGADSFTLK